MEQKKDLQKVLWKIKGGIDGFSSILAEYFLIMNRTKLKKQILKSNEINLPLKDLDQMQVGEVIKYVAGQQFDYNNVDILFTGMVDIFEKGELSDKCRIYINNSDLSEWEKESLKDTFKDFTLVFEVESSMRDVFSGYESSILPRIQDYLQDLSIELPHRLKNLRLLLDTLHIAIEKNEEVKDLAEKDHLVETASYLNEIYEQILNFIRRDYQDYINLLNHSNELSFEYSSRRKILEKLIEGSQVEKFLEWEKILKSKKHLNSTFDKWLTEPVHFVRFYAYAEHHNIFQDRHRKRSTGIKLLRELYNFQEEGDTMDFPTKRRSELQNAKGEFFYL